MAFLPMNRIKLLARSVSDRLLAGLALIVLSPVLLLISAAIKLDTRGPVFYRDRRLGLGGSEFRVYKFRTMVDGAEKIGLGRNVAVGDARITRVGAVLRRTSLDELPQLINVVLGEMSLVGPRPAPVSHVPLYTPRQWGRLAVRPGLTGWAQINGRNSLSWEERIELDLWYIDNWSLSLDLRILARTPRALLSGDGLYGPDGVTTDLGASEPPSTPS